jgi:hypothetical protein
MPTNKNEKEQTATIAAAHFSNFENPLICDVNHHHFLFVLKMHPVKRKGERESVSVREFKYWDKNKVLVVMGFMNE